MSPLAIKIRRHLAERQMQQKALAASARMKANRLTQILAGRTKPRAMDIERLAAAMGMTVDELLA